MARPPFPSPNRTRPEGTCTRRRPVEIDGLPDEPRAAAFVRRRRFPDTSNPLDVATAFRFATSRGGNHTLNVAKRIGRTCLSLYASAMSRPCTVSAQITKIDTAMNTIAHTGYQGSHANATSAHNTAMITPTVRAHTAPLNR